MAVDFSNLVFKTPVFIRKPIEWLSWFMSSRLRIPKVAPEIYISGKVRFDMHKHEVQVLGHQKLF